MKSRLPLLTLLVLVLAAYSLCSNPAIMPGYQSPTITVSGYASSEQTNQMASFNAGVYALNDNKETAVNNVNNTINQIVESLKTFGIPEGDIKTQNLSIYQMEEPIDGTSRTKQGQWRASSDVQITLRDLSKANDLTNLLTASGANNVYGPNFSVDDTNPMESELLNQAVKNATTKAQSIAQANNRQLGKITAIIEGGAQSPVPMRDMMGLGGGGAGLMPGSTTVSKTVSVTFELR